MGLTEVLQSFNHSKVEAHNVNMTLSGPKLNISQ